LRKPRILIDESLPIDLADELVPLTVATVRKLGSTGLKNGELLRRAETAGFTVLLTADQSLQYLRPAIHARAVTSVTPKS
jgi:predicted nuclease of predicted toxin-antitoxin system